MSVRLKPLTEQVIVITGASSGIGLATARMAAQRGAQVMLIARNGPALAKIVAGIVADGGSADYAVADVGDHDALAAAAGKAIARFGRIDTWVNNAGVAIYAKLMDTPDDEHRRLFRTNYFGMVNGSRIAVDHLRAGGGALITVASVASDMPSPILGAYTASKHAVKAFTESLRIELEMDRAPIVVTLVKPAGMATPIGAHAANHLEGEAKIPPPAYKPALTAEAILACAERPQREITVGGIGRLQVLFANHFPALFDRLAPLAVPLLANPAIAKTEGNSLARPSADGAERSAIEVGKGFSIYTSNALHPNVGRAVLAIGLAGAGLAWFLTSRGRRQA